ncbi:MAG: DUF932 domain-containing protein [Clostridia bacterium]|nr:DUF932 domain-containing protein [Clostridia bacterium]
MSNKINAENTIAKLLGQTSQEKLIRIVTDNENEAIGNFSKLKEVAYDINRRSSDFNAKWGNMFVTHDTNNQNIFLEVENRGVSYAFSNNGLTALCNAVGVPTTYVKRCMEASKADLACDNINTWIKTLPREKEMFLRTTDDRLYGLLSNKYTIFDDHEVLDAVEDILSPHHNYLVKNYYISPEILKMRIVSRDKININGEELSFGFDIKNSRVGRASCEIAIIIFRWICSNGMIFGGGKGFMYTKKHIAINREQFITEFVEMLDHAPDTVEYIKRSIETSQQTKLDSQSIQNLINKFKAENISRNACGRIEQMMDEKYNRTLWGMTQSITELAQEYNLETREKMEEFAGKILLAKAV